MGYYDDTDGGGYSGGSNTEDYGENWSKPVTQDGETAADTNQAATIWKQAYESALVSPEWFQLDPNRPYKTIEEWQAAGSPGGSSEQQDAGDTPYAQYLGLYATPGPMWGGDPGWLGEFLTNFPVTLALGGLSAGLGSVVGAGADVAAGGAVDMGAGGSIFDAIKGIQAAGAGTPGIADAVSSGIDWGAVDTGEAVTQWTTDPSLADLGGVVGDPDLASLLGISDDILSQSPPRPDIQAKSTPIQPATPSASDPLSGFLPDESGWVPRPAGETAAVATGAETTGGALDVPGATGAFDVSGATGTGLEAGMQPGPATYTEFTVNPGQTAAQAAAGVPATTSTTTSLIPGISDQVLSGILQGGLGYLGAEAQGDAYSDVANQMLAIGQPYRDTLSASYDPGFDLMAQPGYGDAFDRAADISTRAWAAKSGNPAGNPTAQAGILNDVWAQNYLPALANYRGQLGQFGGLGLNTSGAASLAAAGQEGGAYDAIGYGIGTALKKPSPLEDLIEQMGKNYSLTVAGNKVGG